MRLYRQKLQRALAVLRCHLAGVATVEPLFDTQYYISRYPDVVVSGMDPLFHYLWFGSREGRQPNPLFDGVWYISRYPDVAGSGYHPLLHFIRIGAAEGRQPHRLFDTAWYLSRYPDVDATSNALSHFLLHGAAEGRMPSSEFVPEDYLAANPDVAKSGLPAAFHFLKHGLAENRPLRRDEVRKISDSDYFPVALSPKRRRPQSVDIVVPVYKGFQETQACLNSFFAARCAVPYRLIVINDASPERALDNYLRKLSDSGSIKLITNQQNQGFVRSVNSGITFGTSDIILLNSDTVVFDAWVDRLAGCAYAAPRIGTVTPFSNNATICSYPKFCEDNEVPSDLDVAALDRDFARVNAGRFIEIPTAVGFCMYIRRSCVEEVGLFDAETFGLGYGEENDFCMRAAQRGWRSVLACDVFVLHTGSVSFGKQSGRIENALQIVANIHPNYLQIVADHIKQDPARAFRTAVAAYRIKHSGRKIFLAVLHALGGGVAQHVQELIEDTRQNILWITLQPFNDSFLLECHEPEYRLSLHIRFENTTELLASLRALGVERFHVHHTMGYPDEFENVLAESGLPFDFTVHDYFGICPYVNLSDPAGVYCGEPSRSGCDYCIEDRATPGGVSDITSWRHKQTWLFTADRVIAPSLDAATRITRYHPHANVIAAAHRESAPSPVKAYPLPAAKPLRVAVLGMLAIHKGFLLLKECAVIAASQQLPLEFVLIGAVEDQLREEPLPFDETGRYKPEELPAIIRNVAPDLVWFPARWPETFSYTLSTCLELGIPVAVPDIGAFPERVAGRAWSWVRPHRSSATEWVDFFVFVRSAHFVTGIAPAATAPQSQARKRFYSAWGSGDREGGKGIREKDVLSVAAVVSAFGHTGQIQACGYVRVICPLTHPLLANTVRLELLAPAVAARSVADILIIQRASIADVKQAEKVINHCRKSGIRLVYETDDDLFSIGSDHVEYSSYAKRLDAAKLLASEADCVTASTPQLAAKLVLINQTTLVIPNFLDERLWYGSAAPETQSRPLRLVYAGTVTHKYDLEFLREVVGEVQNRHGKCIQLDIVGVSEGRQSDWYRTIPVPAHVAVSYPRYSRWFQEQAAVYGWHWGLAPLLDTPFNRCKSPVKVFEYAGAGLPSICSNVIPYSDLITHGVNGLLIGNDPQLWMEALESIIAEPERHNQLRVGAEAVMQAHTLRANSAVYMSLIQTIRASRNDIQPRQRPSGVLAGDNPLSESPFITTLK